MGTVTAIEQVEQIRRELRELDLKNSPCPVDRRRAEKEAEAQAQKAHDAKEQQRAASWWAAVDQRITQHLRYYSMSGDEEHPGALTEAIGRAMGENRMKARAELKDAIEEERLSVDAKLAELEARLKSVPGKLPVVKSSWQPETVTYSNVEPQLRDLRAAASGLGLQIVALIARDESEIDRVFETLTQQKIQALLVTADGFFFGLQDKLATLAARYGLPAFYPLSDYVRAGGLVSYGANLAESWRQAGTYVARIVKGAKPSDLPIMVPVQFELVINTTTAKALGLEIPPKVLALVDRVVE
jgi:hypothetical protein